MNHGAKDIVGEVRRNIEELENKISQIDKFLEIAPWGSLKYQQKKSGVYFYRRDREVSSNKRKLRYIPRKDMAEVQRLGQKGYLQNLKPVLVRELAALKDFADRYRPEEKFAVYRNMSHVRREIVQPVFPDADQRVRQWEEEQYEVYDAHAENLKYETNQGEKVRSKSELILANLFYQQRERVRYKYERPLSLLQGGRQIVVHPDFTLLDQKSGDIFFWEHAGMMDDPGYVEEFLRKINLYVSNDILPGDRLIITCESSVNPFNVSLAKKMLEHKLTLR